MTHKICSACDQDKPLSEYYKNKITPDGLTYGCKECHKKRVVRWISNNKKKHNKYVKSWYKRNKCKAKKINRDYKRKRYNSDPVYRRHLLDYSKAYYKKKKSEKK